MPRALSPEIRNKIIELYGSGRSTAEIAIEIGKSDQYHMPLTDQSVA